MKFAKFLRTTILKKISEWMLLLFFQTPSQTWQGVVTLNEHVQAQSFSVFSTRFSGLYENI